MSLTRSLTRPIISPLTRSVAGAGGGVINPLTIPGLKAWWDNADPATMFSDTALTTPAVVDGTVGSRLDKSGNGRAMTTTSAGVRPVMRQRADGKVYLDYSSGKTASVPSSESIFNYLHNGSGGCVVAFVTFPASDQTSIYMRNASATTSAGFSLARNATHKGMIATIYRAASGTTVATFSSAGTKAEGVLNSNVPRMIVYSYKNNGAADDVKMSFDSSRTVITAPTANAPSNADAQLSLEIPTSFRGFEHECMVFDQIPDASTLERLYLYFRQKHDFVVPASVDVSAIVGGQSNAVGKGALAGIPVASTVGAYIYDKANDFRLAYDPAHSNLNEVVVTDPTSGIGAPVASFIMPAASALHDAGVSTLFIPCAVGATGMPQWDTPETAGDPTTMFGALVARWNAAAGRGANRIIVWSGHETGTSYATADYINGGVGDNYQNRLVSLFTHIREHTDPAAPIIFTQLASQDLLADAEGLAESAEAQRQVELLLPNVHMVVQHDVARNASPDDIHVSTTGLAVVGSRIALAIREHVLGHAVNGTGPRMVSASYVGSTITLTCDKTLNTTAGNYGSLFRVYAGGVEQTVSSANRGSNASTVEIVCSAPLTGPVTLTYGYRAGPASSARTDFVADADGLPLPLFGPVLVTL